MQNQNGVKICSGICFSSGLVPVHNMSLESELGSLRVQATFRDLCCGSKSFKKSKNSKSVPEPEWIKKLSKIKVLLRIFVYE